MKTREMLVQYQKAHREPWNQILHYAFAWTGHFHFEGNQPAGLRYPLVGFYAGFLWFFLRTAELATRRSLLRRVTE